MRRQVLAALLLTGIFACASSSRAAGIRVERDIKYVPDGDPSQALDLYLPELPPNQPADAAPEKPLPILVWIHGGGWSGGNKAGCPMARFVGKGYLAASVEYRFSQKAKFPAQIQDCQAAIRWLRGNAKKYNIDPDRIGVAGDSAGGHLVALLGTAGGKKAFAPIGGNEDQSDRVQAVCDFYGPTDFNSVMQQAEDDKNVRNVFKWNTPSDPFSNLIGVNLGSDQNKGESVSPVHYVSKDNPPFLILHGDHDALVPFAQTQELAAQLEKVGVPVTVQRLPGAGHGGAQFELPATHRLIDDFFDKYLRGADKKIEALPESDVTLPAK